MYNAIQNELFVLAVSSDTYRTRAIIFFYFLICRETFNKILSFAKESSTVLIRWRYQTRQGRCNTRRNTTRPTAVYTKHEVLPSYCKQKWPSITAETRRSARKLRNSCNGMNGKTKPTNRRMLTDPTNETDVRRARVVYANIRKSAGTKYVSYLYIFFFAHFIVFRFI